MAPHTRPAQPGSLRRSFRKAARATRPPREWHRKATRTSRVASVLIYHPCQVARVLVDRGESIVGPANDGHRRVDGLAGASSSVPCSRTEQPRPHPPLRAERRRDFGFLSKPSKVPRSVESRPCKQTRRPREPSGGRKSAAPRDSSSRGGGRFRRRSSRSASTKFRAAASGERTRAAAPRNRPTNQPIPPRTGATTHSETRLRGRIEDPATGRSKTSLGAPPPCSSSMANRRWRGSARRPVSCRPSSMAVASASTKPSPRFQPRRQVGALDITLSSNPMHGDLPRLWKQLVGFGDKPPLGLNERTRELGEKLLPTAGGRQSIDRG